MPAATMAVEVETQYTPMKVVTQYRHSMKQVESTTMIPRGRHHKGSTYSSMKTKQENLELQHFRGKRIKSSFQD
jgi:hypothetical protein